MRYTHGGRVTEGPLAVRGAARFLFSFEHHCCVPGPEQGALRWGTCCPDLEMPEPHLGRLH